MMGSGRGHDGMGSGHGHDGKWVWAWPEVIYRRVR